jgi:uncharacterized protein with PIN domain
MIEIIEDHQDPICPHCEKEIRKVSAQKMQSTLGVRYIYFCSQCRKVLGISQRKGFWMG